MTREAPRAPQRPTDVPSPFGTRSDPYYWMRDDARADPEVLAYLAAENAYRDAVLAPPRGRSRQRLYDEIVGRLRRTTRRCPRSRTATGTTSRYETGREYPVYARRAATREAPEQVLLDANALAARPRLLRGRRPRGQPRQPHARLCRGHGRPARSTRCASATSRRRELAERLDERRAGPRVGRRQPHAAVRREGPRDAARLPGHARTCSARRPASDTLRLRGDRTTSFYTGVYRGQAGRYLYIVLQSTVSSEYRYARRRRSRRSAFRVALPRERDHEYQLEDARRALRDPHATGRRRTSASSAAPIADGRRPRARWRERDRAPQPTRSSRASRCSATSSWSPSARGALAQARASASLGRPAREFLIDGDEPACTMALGANDGARHDAAALRATRR